MLGTVWFCLVAWMVAVYVILDGYDLGAGIVHLFVARSDDERRQVLKSIGPFWDGNEVWLLAGGGTLYFAFPALYAASFSGFYLPLTMVLWLLMLRGIAIEFRSHVESPVWRPLWDAVFGGSSALLAIFFGVALGNVVRGVPLDSSGFFFLPLWTNFGIGGELGILDWYTVVVGLTALAALILHGALWVAWKTDGLLEQRCRLLAVRAWWAAAALLVLLTVLSFEIQPQLGASYAERPWGYVVPAIAVIALVLVRMYVRRPTAAPFLASSVFIAAMLSSVAYGLYPYVLPARPDPRFGLTISSAAASSYGLRIGLAWWIPGMLLAAGYLIFTYRQFSGKVRISGEGY
ncbi:MAG TPA: cytochrome d ubiquinol oxidase subunit II [Bryobacteraceae bacterium]|nr:cytochrome d ubiquinol oxidase subunit II [Bryobacteraceae bacterium]